MLDFKIVRRFCESIVLSISPLEILDVFVRVFEIVLSSAKRSNWVGILVFQVAGYTGSVWGEDE